MTGGRRQIYPQNRDQVAIILVNEINDRNETCPKEKELRIIGGLADGRYEKAP